MKKPIALLLAGAMFVSALPMLAACADKVPAEIDWTVDLSQKITLKGMYPNTANSMFREGAKVCDTANIIEDKTGYNIEYYEVSASGGDNDIQRILSTEQEYHFLKLDEAQYHPYLNQGSFLDLTDLLFKTPAGRKLYEIIDLMPYGWDSVSTVDEEGNKHIYGIPDFGYCVMTDSALIWNTEHLKQVGYDHVPENMTEANDALVKMQEHFGSSSKTYSALGIPGPHSCEIVQFKGAFEVPNQFYLDENGNVQQYIYSDNLMNYAKYMNSLRRQNIISQTWQKAEAATTCQYFAQGEHSVVYLPYWHVNMLLNACVADGRIGAGKDPDYVKENLIDWTVRIRGDGSHGTVNQEKARTEGGEAGVSYYTVIPQHMAATALYTIDFLSKKLEAFADYYGGTEGVHWNKVDKPAGAPEYDPENPDEILQYEDFDHQLVFLEPWEYTYHDYTPIYEDVLQEDGETRVKTLVGAQQGEEIHVTGGGFWVKLTERYLDMKVGIVENSQYCNGTNKIVANRLFHLRETGFNGWRVVSRDDDTIIHNPMSMSPPMDHWAPISIRARTQAKDGLKAAISAKTEEKAISTIENTRNSLKTTKVKGYFLWCDDIVNEMTAWYREVKLNMK